MSTNLTYEYVSFVDFFLFCFNLCLFFPLAYFLPSYIVGPLGPVCLFHVCLFPVCSEVLDMFDESIRADDVTGRHIINFLRIL